MMRQMDAQAGLGTRAKALAVVLAVIILACGNTAPAFAQADPATQALQQNQRQAVEAAAANQPSGGADVVTPPTQRAELPPPGGPKVLLKSVTFDPPSAFLSKAELDAIVAHYIGRRLDFSAISNLVRDVNDLYAKKGVVTAGAILPPQHLTSGELKVQLVEGRQGIVTVVGEHRTRNELLLKSVRLTRNGDIVDVPTASQDIARFNQSHHAQLSLLLQPGATFGLTDLTLGVTEPPPGAIQFSLDNEGVSSTGEIEASVNYNNYGLLGADDNLMFYATASQGSLAGTVNFDMPVNSSGTRVAVGVTGSSIKVISGPTAPLDITGQSAAATGTITQPLYVRSDVAVIGLGSLSYGVSRSFAGATPLVDSSTIKTAIGAALSYTNDRLSVGMQPQLIYALADDHLFGTQRGIVIFAGSANGEAKLSDAFSLVGRGAWQYTNEALLPGSLLFQIGGPGTVRGYPSDGVGGDSGYFAETELHWKASGAAEGLELYALGDFGQVFSTFPAVTTMASVGAGLSYNWQNHVSFDLSAVVPIIHAVPDQSSFTVYAKLTGRLD